MARIPKKTNADAEAADAILEQFRKIFQNDEDFENARRLREFQKLLDRQPSQSKIKVTEEGYSYLPIATVEKQLKECFLGLVQYTIISKELLVNEYTIHCRLEVFHPVQKVWLSYDGVGSGVLPQKNKTSPQDFVKFKDIDGAKLSLPNAYAESIKNAAKKVGKWFGSDLNRIIEDNKRIETKQVETPVN